MSATFRSLIGDTLFNWISIYNLEESHVSARRKFFNCTILYRVAAFNPCEVYLVGIHPNPGPTCWSDSLCALYLNARSLKAIVKSVDDAKKLCKITLLQPLVYGGDVVLITETWLKAAIFDTEILPGYTIYRSDRGARAGGVLVAIKRDIQSARRNDLERESTELVVVELRIGHNKPVLLYCFYHPDIAPGTTYSTELFASGNW